MRRINEKDYASYTITASTGWTMTVYRYRSALDIWNRIAAGTLYGTRHNGMKAILDTK